MIVGEVYRGGRRVHRVYKGGELIWFVGDILPLSGSAILEQVDILKGGLTSAAVALGDADNYPRVEVWCDLHGTAIRAVMASAQAEEFVGLSHMADLRIVYIRTGDLIRQYIVQVRAVASGMSARATLGSLFAEHSVEVRAMATALDALATIGSYTRSHKVSVYERATAVGALALIGAINQSHKVSIYERTTAVGALARLGSLFGTHRITVYGHATGIKATAVSGRIDDSAHVTTANFLVGTGAVAKCLDGTADLAVKWQNYLVLTVPEIICPYGNVNTRVGHVAENIGTAAPVARFGVDSALDLQTTTESQVTILPSVLASSEHHANLSASVSGGLTDSIKIVSASVEEAVSLNFETAAYLSDYELPVESEGDLYVRQAYTAAQVGDKLLLSEQEMREMSEKMVSAFSESTIPVDTVIEANLSDWKLPVALGDNLYVPQVAGAMQNGTDLYMSDWYSPVKSGNDLHIQQVYEATPDDDQVKLL